MKLSTSTKGYRNCQSFGFGFGSGRNQGEMGVSTIMCLYRLHIVFKASMFRSHSCASYLTVLASPLEMLVHVPYRHAKTKKRICCVLAGCELYFLQPRLKRRRSSLAFLAACSLHDNLSAYSVASGFRDGSLQEHFLEPCTLSNTEFARFLAKEVRSPPV